jgi:hypothetical protein
METTTSSFGVAYCLKMAGAAAEQKSLQEKK